MSLTRYLNDKKCIITEGYSRSCNKETIILQCLCVGTNIKNILEIGFNAGHSADLFLNNNSVCNVISFDIGHHSYVKIAKEFIDKTYPNRHKLILGDSTKTIPEYDNTVKYDLIFIDGGHTYDIARSDLLNCKRFAHKDTIVLMDDTIYTRGWEKEYTVGPTKAWLEGIKNNIITEISHTDFEVGRGISWGTYVVDN
jgi:predicted O-methyltransferase YrrM